MQLSQEQRDEITQIRDIHAGIVRPRDLVAFASDPRTALHEAFIWDDALAANEHRLHTARNLIAIYVTVIRDHGRNITVRPFISNATIRHEIGQTSGYADIDFVRGNLRLELSVINTMLSAANAMLKRFGAFPNLRRLVEDFIEMIQAEQARMEASMVVAASRVRPRSHQRR